MEEREYFLAQYNQVWQQRRQHVALIWAIPTIAFAVTTFLAQALFPDEGSPRILRSESVWALIIMAVGLSGLLLRHNFFIKCLGLLLQEQDSRRAPFVLPQLGTQFRDIYRERLGWWEKIGAIKDGTFWWVVASYGIILLFISVTPIDFTAPLLLKNLIELLKWVFPAILAVMFLWEANQYFFRSR